MARQVNHLVIVNFWSKHGQQAHQSFLKISKTQIKFYNISKNFPAVETQWRTNNYINKTAHKQLNMDFLSSSYFSNWLKESMCITSSTHLAIRLQFVKGNEVCAYLFKFATLTGTTIELDNCSAAMNTFSESWTGISNICSVTTEGTISMTGTEATFVLLFIKHYQSFHCTLPFHCSLRSTVRNM